MSSRETGQETGRSVVWTTGSLGATCTHLPILAQLARSGRQIVVVASSDEARVLDPTLMRLRLDHTPDALDAPLSLDRSTLTVELLARLEPDEAIVLRPGVRQLQQAARAGIDRRFALAPAWRLDVGVLATVRVAPPPGHREKAAEALGAALEAAGLGTRPDAPGTASSDGTQLVVPKTWHRVGAERLDAAKIDREAPVLGVVATRAGGAVGRWSGWTRPRFTELLQGLRRRDPSRQIVLLTPAGDLWHAVRLHETTGKIHPVIGPDLPLDGLAAVLGHLDLVVGHDSTLLELAAAVGIGTVGLYTRGSTRRAPRGARHHAFERRHLGALRVETVLDAVDRLLAD
ncbi:MAG: glycosyltransferase family 9 protein [Acidobacteriota bacterium]